jgi:AmmeMemoRadiSam system protein B/AmmeMemoRadiSam system protein A
MPTFSQFNLDTVRRTQYAGTWYEGNGDRLKTQLRNYLHDADDAMKSTAEAVPDQQVLALIAPHAGYLYSGKTAAFSYQATQSPSVKRVFVLGPSHHVALHGVALPAATTFETPIGNLQVDKQTVKELQSYPLFSVQPDVHKVEHSLELQLPFIRQAFGDVKLVPLVVGVLKDEAEIRLIAEVLKGYVSKEDLIVVSSDFTHYGPRYGYTPFPNYSREKIEQLDKEAYSHLAQADLQGFIDFHNRTEDTICGLFPCAVLCAMLPPEARGHLLKYATSQEVVPDDLDNSVSYLSITFTGPQWPENPAKRQPISDAIKLSDEEKKSLLTIARRSLEKWVKEKKVLDPRHETDISITPQMKQCFGAFVTLYKKSADDHEHRQLHSGKELRGCIGNIWPVRSLYQTIVENAIASSSRDYRFNAVSADELNDVQIEISILTPPRRVPSFKDIVLGTDGIILSKHQHQAVFLPQVPTEFGWDLPETLRQLSLKAGLKDNDWKDGAQYDLFQSMPLEE